MLLVNCLPCFRISSPGSCVCLPINQSEKQYGRPLGETNPTVSQEKCYTLVPLDTGARGVKKLLLLFLYLASGMLTTTVQRQLFGVLGALSGQLVMMKLASGIKIRLWGENNKTLDSKYQAIVQ